MLCRWVWTPRTGARAWPRTWSGGLCCWPAPWASPGSWPRPPEPSRRRPSEGWEWWKLGALEQLWLDTKDDILIISVRLFIGISSMREGNRLRKWTQSTQNLPWWKRSFSSRVWNTFCSEWSDSLKWLWWEYCETFEGKYNFHSSILACFTCVLLSALSF